MSIRHPFSFRLGALMLACAAAAPVGATGLVEAWQAAVHNDKAHAVASASHAAAGPRRDQASALWRPQVGLSASLGLASNQTEVSGAQFTAPGLGTSTGVGFNTSINNGTAGRWAVSAVQPIYNPERRVQQRQLGLSVDSAEIEWQAALQALMLRTAERYFDVALAELTWRVQQRQLDAVQRTANEVAERFKLGSAPVTDTHEAQARLAAVRAQWLLAQNDLQHKRRLLADSTGLPAAELATHLPLAGPSGAALQASPDAPDGASAAALALWISQAEAGNPGLGLQRLAVETARQEAARHSAQASVRVDLVAQVSRDRLSGSGDFGSASNGASNQAIGLQLTIPLFTGGLRDAQQAEAWLLADKAVAQTDLLRQQVVQQVSSTWLGLGVGVERVAALAQALQASASRRDATQLGYQVGHRSTLDLLNAENDSAVAGLALAQARVGLWLDRLRLAALAGQLDEAALRRVDLDLAPASPR
jgi:outer membrane protein